MKKHSTGHLPNRPISRWLTPLRKFVRWVRLANLKILLGKKINIGKNVNLGKQNELRPPEWMTIGDNVYIGGWFIVETNLEIGSDVLISSRVSCVGNDHEFEKRGVVMSQSRRLKPCTIIFEGDNLVGFGTILVGNIRVGKGCIIGAGSVVTHDLPANTVCVGVPAKPIRGRYEKRVPKSTLI
jgi:acetyltransferase-like isoleucine patch superfamily enzyme